MSAPAKFPLREAFNFPMSASAVEGEVVVSGPGNIAAAMTPAAAELSASALLAAARAARDQGA